jgi:hypothetical protein
MSFLEDSLRSTADELFIRAGGRLVADALGELGFDALLTEEPRAAVSILCESQGRHRGTSRLLELVMASQLADVVEPARAGLVLPLRAVAFDPEGGSIDGVLLDGAPSGTVILAVAGTGDRVDLYYGTTAVAEAVGGIDPDAGWIRVRGVEIGERVTVADGVWAAAVSIGSLAVAYETLGLTAAMLDLSVAYVTERHQFGVPIGSFQAVQHRLADVHVALEAARAVGEAAWAERDPQFCAAALGSARRAFVIAQANCQQVLGAIGCTWEHDLHRFIRRGVALGLLLDHRVGLADAVGSAIVATNRIEVFE